jgi:SAM-dependent methyltransferase
VTVTTSNRRGDAGPHAPDMTATHGYVLGHDQSELDRLIHQARFYGELTEMALLAAGIGTGMRVIDAGCGAGDVSFLISRVVGPSGEVIAVDQAPEAIEVARRRALGAGVENIHFIEADLATLELDAPVDVVVGRFILMHVEDPIAVLRNLVSHVADGGIVLFQEFDIGIGEVVPSFPLVDQITELILRALTAAGIDIRAGLRLHHQFLAAGLPAPQMLSLGRVVAAPADESIEAVVGLLQTLMPMIEQFGLATADEVALDTLAERLREGINAVNGVSVDTPLITAWTRVSRSVGR